MFVSTISSSILNDRIDAGFYEPEVAILLKNMVDSNLPTQRLSQLSSRMNSGPFGSSLLASSYVPKERGVIFYRPVDCKDSVVDSDNGNVYILPVDNERLKSSSFRSGAILMTKIGNSIGDISVVPKSMPLCNISGNMMGFVLKSTDPYYAVSFFRCRYGAGQIKRGIIGGPMPKIDMSTISALVVSTPHNKVQVYIGEKVRQAERLRERARKLEKDFQEQIQNVFPAIFEDGVQSSNKHSWVSSQALDGNLNPGTYNPERLRIRKAISERHGKQLWTIATVETPTSSTYNPDDVYIGLDCIPSTSCGLTPSTIVSEEVEGTVRVLKEGVVISRLRPYLNKVAFIPRELSGAFGSTELLCVTPKGDESSWFIYGVLKLQSTIRQLNPVATGSTHPRVSRDDILDLMIPWVEDAEGLGEKLGQAQQAYFFSERLTQAAKLLVEALIEGKVSEGELKQAQEGLERGDNSLDREILSRLTRRGIDVNAPSLFSDLDVLYDAIAQASV